MLAIGTVVRSFDFDEDDERGYFFDGVIRGYARCVVQYTEDGEPYEGFTPATAASDGCLHYDIEVLTHGDGWAERAAAGRIPDHIFPATGPSFFGGELVKELALCLPSNAEVRRLLDAAAKGG